VIRLIRQVSLDGFIGAIRIADEDLEALIDHRVDAALDLSGEAGDLP